jgi:hypothetical protein
MAGAQPQVIDSIDVSAQLLAMALAELREPVRVMAEPPAQTIARRQIACPPSRRAR